MTPVLAINKWASNGHLILDCARLGYLQTDWITLDPTYGYGTFWSEWRPEHLIATDLNSTKSPRGISIDFTALPWSSQVFDAAVFDPPYKLNGTASDTGGVDERFGVDDNLGWRDRMDLILRGAREVARVTDKMLLVKCQDQVVSSKKRWQTRAIEDAVGHMGFGLRDRFDFLSYRPQPDGRRQKNAHVGSSQLLVFERGWDPWR